MNHEDFNCAGGGATGIRPPDLGLPSIYGITHADGLGVSSFLERLEAALARGLRLVQVREPDMSTGDRLEFARAVVARARAHGARILVNGDGAMARAAGADGVHLRAVDLMAATSAPHAFWAASCHDAAELERAAALGASFAVLSPVLATASHPGVPGRGWGWFERHARACPLPVFALGGMSPAMLAEARRHGAHGIALLRGIW